MYIALDLTREVDISWLSAAACGVLALRNAEEIVILVFDHFAPNKLGYDLWYLERPKLNLAAGPNS